MITCIIYPLLIQLKKYKTKEKRKMFHYYHFLMIMLIISFLTI